MNAARVCVPTLAANWSILLPGLYLAGTLLAGAVIVAVVNRWRRLTRSTTCSASDQLAHFRSLYEQGTISEEEFNRLRAVLGGELRSTLNVPASRPKSPPPAGASGPESEQSGIRPA